MTEKNNSGAAPDASARRSENFRRFNQLDEEYVQPAKQQEIRMGSGGNAPPQCDGGIGLPQNGERMNRPSASQIKTPGDKYVMQSSMQAGARSREKAVHKDTRADTQSGRNIDKNNKEKKKRTGSFGRFLAVYCAVFAVLIAAGLFVFNGFIASYEKTRHEHIIGEYISALGESDIERLVGETPLCAFESFSGICETLREAAESPAFSCIKSADYSDDLPVYSIYSDGAIIGTAALKKSGGKSFGFVSYEVSEFALGMPDGGRISAGITVPHGASVTINGISAETFLTCETVPYRGASVWEKDQPGLPQTDVYTADGFIVPPKVAAHASGEELSCRSSASAGKAEYLFDISAGRHDLIITAPECAEVTLGGIPLTEKEITERGIAYKSYKDSEFNRAAGELPVSVVYTVTGLFTYPDISVTVNGTAAEPYSETDSDGTVRAEYGHPDAALYSAEIHMPSSAEGYVNGVKLTGDQLVSSSSVYDGISDIAGYINNPLTESVYRVDGLYRIPEVTVSFGGESISPEREADGSYRIENQTDETLVQEHSELVRDVITKYVEYTAAGYTDLNDGKCYSAILGCTRTDSPAYNGIVSSRFSFTQNIPCKINSLTVDSYDYRRWGENCFSCSADFTAKMRNFRDVTDTITGLELYFTQDGGEWKLVKMQFS